MLRNVRCIGRTWTNGWRETFNTREREQVYEAKRELQSENGYNSYAWGTKFLIYSLKDTTKKENAPADAQKSRKGNIMTGLGLGKRVVLQICLHLHNYNR